MVRIFPDEGELILNTTDTRRYWQTITLEELNSDTQKSPEERNTEMTKSEGRFAAFQDKYKESINMAARRRRELRRRLNGVPALTTSESISQRYDSSGWHGSVASVAISIHPSGMDNSARSSSSSIAEFHGRKDTGVSFSSATSPTVAASAGKSNLSGAHSSDMAKAVATALLQRTRSLSGRGGNVLDDSPGSNAGTAAGTVKPPPESDIV